MGSKFVDLCGFPQFIITFQVMDIHPVKKVMDPCTWRYKFYSHQKLNFLFEDKLVIVCGEEDSIIREVSLFKYIETEEGIIEVPF